MINQEFKALGIKYEVLANVGICCRDLRGLKGTSFHACVRSFRSVDKTMERDSGQNYIVE